jgi:hypothetical protein
MDTVAEASVRVAHPWPLGSVVAEVGATVSFVSVIPLKDRPSPTCEESPWMVTVI